VGNRAVKLSEMRLPSMVLAVRELMDTAPGHQLSFEEKLGIVVDREWLDRDNRRLARRLKEAKLATRASLDNVLCDPERGLDKRAMRIRFTPPCSKCGVSGHADAHDKERSVARSSGGVASQRKERGGVLFRTGIHCQESAMVGLALWRQEAEEAGHNVEAAVRSSHRET
jgi:hypothetical protein